MIDHKPSDFPGAIWCLVDWRESGNRKFMGLNHEMSCFHWEYCRAKPCAFFHSVKSRIWSTSTEIAGCPGKKNDLSRTQYWVCVFVRSASPPMRTTSSSKPSSNILSPSSSTRKEHLLLGRDAPHYKINCSDEWYKLVQANHGVYVKSKVQTEGPVLTHEVLTGGHRGHRSLIFPYLFRTCFTHQVPGFFSHPRVEHCTKKWQDDHGWPSFWHHSDIKYLQLRKRLHQPPHRCHQQM